MGIDRISCKWVLNVINIRILRKYNMTMYNDIIILLKYILKIYNFSVSINTRRV